MSECEGQGQAFLHGAGAEYGHSVTEDGPGFYLLGLFVLVENPFTGAFDQ